MIFKLSNLTDSVSDEFKPQGVNSTEYYVQSEWGQHWTYSKSCDVLSTRKDGGNSTRALSMGFGPYHQYYYEFDNWKYWKIGDPDISKIVKENAMKFVSFGPKGAVIVVLKSGAYYFRNLPTELQDCITGRARSGNEDHNRIASVSLGNNDAYFVTFEDGCWQYSGIPSSMHKYIQEQEIKKNYRNETFEQIAFSQDLEEWYLRTNKRWWYQSRKLRSLEDTYKK